MDSFSNYANAKAFYGFTDDFVVPPSFDASIPAEGVPASAKSLIIPGGQTGKTLEMPALGRNNPETGALLLYVYCPQLATAYNKTIIQFLYFGSVILAISYNQANQLVITGGGKQKHLAEAAMRSIAKEEIRKAALPGNLLNRKY